MITLCLAGQLHDAGTFSTRSWTRRLHDMVAASGARPWYQRAAAPVAAALLAVLCASGPTLARAQGSADDALIAHGEYLAKAGDCIACHSAAGGKPFAGGLPMPTPMGKIYTTNITPDPDTGIGRYSEADFVRATREGVAKDGRNLYPAMPYPSYAKVSDDDMKAMYAYFMHGVEPVRQANRPSDIPWPLNMRWPLKLWNLVFLDKQVYVDKGGQDALWNRGAYLVQGLGHCGACHTPRGIGFNEKALDESGKAFLSGAAIDNWFAANLTGDTNTGLGRWTEADLATFMKRGANAHASAFGSMTDVINHSTQNLNDVDTKAIAHYLKAIAPAGRDEGGPYAYDPKATVAALLKPAGNAGAATYTTYCLHCHGVDGRGYAPMFAPLAGNPNVLEKDPSSLINVTLNGTGPLVIGGVPAPYPMPAYHGTLDDQQVADLLTFIRAGWNNQAPAVSSDQVAKLRKTTVAAP
jgi:alcohol dehydrogenase (quinone), cytochrome c subunit